MSDRLIDAHVHLDPNCGSALQAAADLDRGMSASGVDRALVLHLLQQPWPVEELAEAIAAFPRMGAFVNVDPLAADPGKALRRGIEELGFIGLKLHPRLQQFSIEEAPVRTLIAQAGEMSVPVMIDAFPDGDWLMMGFSPLAFARLAKACPQTKIIFGHFGGQHCIDMMMLAKRVPNMWFDISYSFLYFRTSSVSADLVYCCRSMRFQRILFGTDYPDRSLEVAVPDSLQMLTQMGVVGDDRSRLLWRNAAELLGWTEF